jgi:hypothetical protein
MDKIKGRSLPFAAAWDGNEVTEATDLGEQRPRAFRPEA